MEFVVLTFEELGFHIYFIRAGILFIFPLLVNISHFELNSSMCGGQVSKFMSRCQLLHNFYPSEYAKVDLGNIKDIAHVDLGSCRGECVTVP